MMAAMPTTDAADARSLDGSWVGKLAVGPLTLHLVLHFTRGADGAWTATLDSPDQGKLGLPLDQVVVEGGRVEATSQALHGGFTGHCVGDRLEGTWAQGP